MSIFDIVWLLPLVILVVWFIGHNIYKNYLDVMEDIGVYIIRWFPNNHYAQKYKNHRYMRSLKYELIHNKKEIEKKLRNAKKGVVK